MFNVQANETIITLIVDSSTRKVNNVDVNTRDFMKKEISIKDGFDLGKKFEKCGSIKNCITSSEHIWEEFLDKYAKQLWMNKEYSRVKSFLFA